MICCKYKAGDLNKLVNFIRIDKVSDGMGGNTTNETVVISPMVKMIPLSGSERLNSQRLENNVTHRIIARYTPLIKPNLLMRYDGREFQVKYVINLEESGRWLEIQAVEGEAV